MFRDRGIVKGKTDCFSDGTQRNVRCTRLPREAISDSTTYCSCFYVRGYFEAIVRWFTFSEHLSFFLFPFVSFLLSTNSSDSIHTFLYFMRISPRDSTMSIFIGTILSQSRGRTSIADLSKIVSFQSLRRAKRYFVQEMDFVTEFISFYVWSWNLWTNFRSSRTSSVRRAASVVRIKSRWPACCDLFGTDWRQCLTRYLVVWLVE